MHRIRAAVTAPFRPEQDDRLPCDVAQFDIRSATCQIEVEYGVVGLTHGVQNVRGHAAGGRPQVGFRLPAILRLRGKPASHESRQIAHAQIAAEEIRLPFAVRVAGDRGHAVKLPLIRFFAGIRGKHLHMRSGDGHVTELVDDAIEPVEIPMVFDGLEAISAEDGKGHGVDAGLAHQADVVIPDFLRPLVGTIVATESDAASVRGQQFWPYAKSRHARTVISFGRRRRATAHIGYQLIDTPGR